MVDTLPSLIDKQDVFEIVRDQIAGILRAEFDNQEQLADTAGKDPTEYAADIFTERGQPWEQYLNNPRADDVPLINVSVENGNYDRSVGNVVEHQKTDMRYNIDCIGTGVAASTTGGHEPGDVAAALKAQRAYRQVRNILMAAQNTYLQLRGTVWGRWPETVQALQPPIDQRATMHVVAMRLTLQVVFNETAPQIQGNPLEGVFAEIERAADGKILLAAEYDYTTE